MHELSIAVHLVDAACEEVAHRGGGLKVQALHLRLGALSGVVEDALRFSFDLAARGTAIDGARLVIEGVPVSAMCPRCGVERPIESLQSFRCAVCGTPAGAVVGGREILLSAMEVLDDEPAHP